MMAVPAVRIDDDAASAYVARLAAQRAMPAPIAFHASTRYVGLGSSQPRAELLLRESIGWAAIAAKAIAQRIASLELEVVTTKRVDGVEKEIVLPDHELAALLRSPSPTHTQRLMLYLVASHVVTVGEAYLGKIGRGSRVLELHVMQPARIRPIFEKAIPTAFEITDGSGRVDTWAATELVRIWLPDPETLYSAEGYLGPQAIAADASKFASETVRSHYESDATPKVVVEGEKDAPAPAPENLDRFYEDWRQGYDRRSGAFRGLPKLLPPGWAAKVLAESDPATVVALLDHFKKTMLMAYGVPPSIVGDVVDVNRAAAETNQFVFDQHTIKPLADVIADAFTYQLARPWFGPEIRVRFRPFVAADKEYELRREAQDLDKKVRVVNEVRADRGQEPKPWGDLPVGSFADTPYTGEIPDDELGPDQAGALGDGEDDDDRGRARTPAAEATGRRGAGQGGRAASLVDLEWKRFVARERQFVPTFEKRMRRIFAAQQADVLRELAAGGLGRAYARELSDAEVLAIVRRVLSPQRWTRIFRTLTDPVRRSAFTASAKEAIAATGSGKKFQLTERVVSILTGQAESFRERVSDTTLKALAEKVTRALAEGAAEGEAADARAKRVQEAVEDGFDLRRAHARTIARTETLKATQKAQLEGYAQSGVVTRKQWNTSRDDAVRDSHEIDEQVVGLDERFRLANGRTADAPGDDLLPAEDVIGCRCFVTPVLEEE